MHEVLVNRLGGLSLPRKSVVRLTDRPDMTLDVGWYLSQVFDAFVFIRKHSDIFSEKIRVKLLFTLATNTNLTSPPK